MFLKDSKMKVLQTIVDEETYDTIKKFAKEEMTSMAQVNRLILIKLTADPGLLDDLYKKGRALAIRKSEST